MSGLGGVGQPAVDGSPALRTVHGDWDAGQIGNAATIVTVGAALNVPGRGWVIAVATAMQESTLVNTPGGDRDSVGLFQQRPSQGWGSPEQLLDPVYAAGRFYAGLLTVPGWQILPLTDAAQAVQHSATPDAYAKWETDATAMVSGLTAGSGQPTPPSLRPCSTTCRSPANAPSSDTAPAEACGPIEGPTGVPSSFSLPPDTPAAVAIAIGWALQQLGTPYSYGGDCTDPHSGNPARRCDCSSLVQQAYHAAGITLPRTAAAQSRTGIPVHTPEQLRPGDLLFVAGSDGTAENPGHVGLYIGDQLIVEAPHPGASVHLTPLTSYWTADLHARRSSPADKPGRHHPTPTDTIVCEIAASSRAARKSLGRISPRVRPARTGKTRLVLANAIHPTTRRYAAVVLSYLVTASNRKQSSMARKTTIELTDDLDGGKAAETITFGLDGQTYTIDLNARNAKALRKAFAPYVASGRHAKTGKPARGRSRRRTAGGSAASSRDVREWARSQGIQIANRGRIPNDLVAKFQAAHAA